MVGTMRILLAVMLPLLAVVLPSCAARADAAPVAAPGPAVRSSAADPAYPYAGYLAWTITGITPTVLTSAAGSRLQVTGTITNVSKAPIYDLRYVWQRGDPLAGVAAIQAEIATPGRPAAVIGQDWKIVAASAGATRQTDLAAGASVPYLATADIGPDGLDLARRGVYPMMIKVSGDIGQNGQTEYERVGEIHLLTTVLSIPQVTAAAASFPAHPVPINLVWPLVDTPHLGVDGVFLDDTLPAELRPGGRLFGVLTQLTEVGVAPSATTLVVDPELLAEIERMAGGYRVISRPGRAQDPLAPTSAPTTTGSQVIGSGSVTGSASISRSVARPSPISLPAPPTPATGSTAAPVIPSSLEVSRSGTAAVGVPATGSGGVGAPATPTRGPPPNTVAGTGQAVAGAFLAKLRAAAAVRQILVLPYSNPDSVAMIRAGLDDQLAGLITGGRTVAARVLRVDPASPRLITDMSRPEGGLVNDATLAFLSGQGMSTALLSASTITHPGGAIGSVVVDETSNKGALVKAVVTDAELLAKIDELIAKGNAAGLATRLSDLAALLTGGSLDGSGTPLVVAPDNRWTANPTGLKMLSGLLGTLESGGVLTGTSLAAIAATARTPATLAYPAAAQQAELDADYLASVVRDTAWISTVRSSLSRSAGNDAPAPQDLLDPLDQALVAAGSAGLRTDRRVGDAILNTTESTLTNLRSGVQITGGTSYTLAASTSPLLVAVRNDLPYVVRLRVVILGGQAVGMTATDPAAQNIPAGRTLQFKIDTKVVKAGRFVVYAQLLAADGSDWSASAPLTVNSSAYGTLTIILIVVAGGALLLMVVIRIAQRIRHRNDPVGGDGKVGTVNRASTAEPDSVLGAANEPVSASTEATHDHPWNDHPSNDHPSNDHPSNDHHGNDHHGEGRR